MFKTIRTSKATKIIVCYLSMMIFLEIVQPMSAYALTEGPTQPEFNSFTPIGTSDMVDLASGDFNYNIPIMDVGGYPINLAYNSGVTMDQEASWVGLGWNLNIGQINRNVRGLPDDFKGDIIETQNNLKTNVTVSVNPYINAQVFGLMDNTANIGIGLGAGLEVKYNNYNGLSANPSFGASFDLGKNVSLGLSLSSSEESGATVASDVSLYGTLNKTNGQFSQMNGKLTAGISYNSTQGLQNFNLSSSVSGKNFTASLKKKSIFTNTTFTPQKRNAFNNEQISFSFSAGGSVWGVQGEGSISASATIQEIRDKEKFEKAYGYENTEQASGMDLLDFNRENELSTVTKSTNVLPVTNYTYDILSIQSQTLNGTFRPYRGQAGLVYDPLVADDAGSTSISAEIEAGWGMHYGGSVKHTSSINYTSPWITVATPYLKDKPSNNINYEKVYFKNVGEQRVDPEYATLLNTNFGGDKPITLTLSGNVALNKYSKKTIDGYGSNLVHMPSFSTANLRRTNREIRNKGIQKITKAEAISYGLNDKFIKINPNAANHHTAGYLITDENGNRQIFGETAYNIEKDEVTFATNSSTVDCTKGTVVYNPGENSLGNSAGIDHYFNKVKTKHHAHTYLISSVLSSDYEDISNDGPTDDDLGSYTKFEYTKQGDVAYSNSYQWRVPFKPMTASYNEGFKTAGRDQKASYLYGVKELKYIKRIETKTHVALFDLEERLDGYGVAGENGGINTSCKTYYIKSIRLYSKKTGVAFYPNNIVPTSVKPIKTAFFEYDYSLCQNIDNSNNPNASQKGKLTLKKVYFTYQGSNMGKYTPYEFSYANNKPYNPKNYDIWGNYKNNPNTSSTNCNQLSPQDFPYVEQGDKDLQDDNATAWSLNEIKLPSGGKIKLTLESDDYQYVQNKKAMQMFKVFGVSDQVTSDLNEIKSDLYDANGYDATNVVIKIDGASVPANTSDSELVRRCTDGLAGQPIYFDFFLNMTSSKYDHVTGYFEMNGTADIRDIGGNKYIFVPMKKTNREGENSNSDESNPISVAGWFFGRQNLYRQVYDLGEPADGMPNLLSLGYSLVNNLQQMIDIFTGANYRLKTHFKCAKHFDPSKSWIRLNEPSGTKLGGGLRVKKIEMFDDWEEMLGSDVISDVERYKKKYGQEYSYNLENNTSSGVATFEPNMSKENPFVLPFYHGTQKLAAQTYEEKPFGACFFPSPVVTYSRVSVKNITAADDDASPGDSTQEVRKTRSGVVVTHNYTSYDFPTKTDYTNLDKSKFYESNEEAALPNLILGMFGLSIEIKNELTMTQGFYIETNDMNGKVKKQEVFDNNNNLISYVESIYSTVVGDSSTLNNVMEVVNPDGSVSQKAIGVDYDIVNDLRLNYNFSNTAGVNGNLDVLFLTVPFPPFIIPIFIPTAFFDNESHSQTLRTAVTTKVVYKTGILKEKIAYDLGSKVSTRNMAWDSQTGQVILTQTTNEFDDQYYSMSFPAYWYYERMGMATKNIDIRGKLLAPSGGTEQNPNPYFRLDNTITNLRQVFQLGDELYITNTESGETKKVWVFDFNSNNSGILLMDKDGNYIDKCGKEGKNYAFRIIRSGYRNNQMANMASITSMSNPLESGNIANYIYDENGTDPNPKIVNASAIEYKDFWEPQAELDFKIYPNRTPTGNPLTTPPEELTFPTKFDFNPYLFNYKGNWRAEKSYAYLTGRKSSVDGGSISNPRNNGFFTSFNPFYHYDVTTNKWIKDTNHWTFASEVTKYSPYGIELENRDAMDRYSSAQYNYTFTKPMAVVSNAQYKEIAFEGFEDHSFGGVTTIPNYLNRFGFDAVHHNVYIHNAKAHTGRNSLAVNYTSTPYPSSTTQINVSLLNSTRVQQLVDCVTPVPTCPPGWTGVYPNCIAPPPCQNFIPCAINDIRPTDYDNSGFPSYGVSTGYNNCSSTDGKDVYFFVAFTFCGNIQDYQLTESCSGASLSYWGTTTAANINANIDCPLGNGQQIALFVYRECLDYPDSAFAKTFNFTFRKTSDTDPTHAAHTKFKFVKSYGSDQIMILPGYMPQPPCY